MRFENLVNYDKSKTASINKSVSTAKPGYCIWENSLITLKSGESIYWKDLTIGNEFSDGSICEEIQDWQFKPCYEIKINGFNPIVLSNDHLIYGGIKINNSKINNFEKSKKCRENVGEIDENWLCVEDLYAANEILR